MNWAWFVPRMITEGLRMNEGVAEASERMLKAWRAFTPQKTPMR